jgi:DNA-binding response OmpR family regulator
VKKRVLSISNDEALLKTRQYILEQAGFDVVLAWGFSNALKQCESAKFDLVLLGHTLPPEDKAALAKALRKHCDCPVVSVRRSGQHDQLPEADYSIGADDGPEALIAVLRKALGNGSSH